jgi:hypothetical protein
VSAVTVLDIPVDQITARAKEIQFKRVVLGLAAWLLFGGGWLIAKAFKLLWLAMVWSYAAAKLGWDDARRTVPAVPPPPPVDA